MSYCMYIGLRRRNFAEGDNGKITCTHYTVNIIQYIIIYYAASAVIPLRAIGLYRLRY